jgi:hypothetical protein
VTTGTAGRGFAAVAGAPDFSPQAAIATAANRTQQRNVSTLFRDNHFMSNSCIDAPGDIDPGQRRIRCIRLGK